MTNFISDFFENRGWLGLVQKNSNGDLEVAGTTITGVASYTEAQIKDSGFDDSVKRFITVSDWAIDSTGGSALLQVDPLKSGTYKFVQASGLYFDTFADALTALSSLSDWADFKFKCGDVGGGNVILVNTGTQIRPLNGVATLFQKSYGSLTSPTATLSAAGLFTLGETLKIPASLLGVDDRLDIRMITRKNNANAACAPVGFLGTAGTSSDSTLAGISTITTDDTDIESRMFAVINSSSSILTSNSNAILQGTGTANALRDRSTNINTAADMYITLGVGSMSTSDTVNLLYFDVDWRSA